MQRYKTAGRFSKNLRTILAKFRPKIRPKTSPKIGPNFQIILGLKFVTNLRTAPQQS
jgi:hypothetical protein